MPPVHFDGLRDYIVSRKQLPGGNIVCPDSAFYYSFFGNQIVVTSKDYTKKWSTSTNMDSSVLGLRSSEEVWDLSGVANGEYEKTFASCDSNAEITFDTDCSISSNVDGLITSTPSWASTTVYPTMLKVEITQVSYGTWGGKKYYTDSFSCEIIVRRKMLIWQTTGQSANCPLDFGRWEYVSRLTNSTKAERAICGGNNPSWMKQASATGQKTETIGQKISWEAAADANRKYYQSQDITCYDRSYPGVFYQDVPNAVVISGNKATYTTHNNTWYDDHWARFSTYGYGNQMARAPWYYGGDRSVGTYTSTPACFNRYALGYGTRETTWEYSVPNVDCSFQAAPALNVEHAYYCIYAKADVPANLSTMSYDDVMALSVLEEFPISSAGKPAHAVIMTSNVYLDSAWTTKLCAPDWTGYMGVVSNIAEYQEHGAKLNAEVREHSFLHPGYCPAGAPTYAAGYPVAKARKKPLLMVPINW